MTPDAKASLLIVEDEFIVAQHLRASLEAMGYAVVGLADSAEEAVEMAGRLRPDLVLMDIFLSGASDGIEAARIIRRDWGLPVVFLTAQFDDNIIQRAAAAEPYGYLNKPFKIKEVQAAVETALYKASMEAKLAASEQRLRMILDVTSDGAWDCDLTKGVIFFSAKWLTHLGCNVGEAEAATAQWLRRLHPEDRAQFRRPGWGLGKANPALDVELRLRGDDGQWLWCHCRGQAVEFDGHGVATRAVGTLDDVTRHKAAQDELAEARERFLSLARFTSDALLLIRHGQILHFNPAYGQTLGYAAEDLAGSDFFQIIAPHERQRVRGYHNMRMAGLNAPEQYEADVIDKDGRLVRMRLRSRLMRHHGRGVVLTAMRPAAADDQPPRDRHNKFMQNVLDNLPVGLAVFAADTGLVLYMNENYGQAFGWPRDELPSAEKLFERLFPEPGERHENVERIIGRLMDPAAGRCAWQDIVVHAGDGGQRHVASQSISVPEEGVIISTVWDIDAQRRGEQALAASEEKYRQVVENAGEAIVITQGCAIRFCNPITGRFFGLDHDQLPGRDITGLIHPDDRELAAGLFCDDQARQVTPPVAVYRILRQGGEPGWVQSRSAAVTWEGRPAVLSCLTDVTAGMEAQASLAERNETLQAMINASPLAVLGLDRQGKVLFWSGAAQQMLGWNAEEVIGRPYPLIDEDDRASFARSLAQIWEKQETQHLEVRRKVRDGRLLDFNVHTAPIRGVDGRAWAVLGLLEDVTERKRQQRVWARIEAQLSQTRRLEAVGALAAGVAHEFNNILAAVIGYGELAKEELEAGDVASPLLFLENQMKAAQRGRGLVRQILAFSRHGSGSRRRVDLGHAVDEQVKLLRAVTPANVAIETELWAQPLMAEADAAQIQQVALNLTNNAIEALAGGDGVIRFRTRLVTVEENEAEASPDLKPGRYLCLEVEDDGPGMPVAVLERACEPFFSTKPGGHGVGLGLAEVHGIVTAHGGALRLLSRPRQGATAQVFIPLCADEDAAPAQTSPQASPAVGVARIMLVDDEPSLVDVFQRVLSRLGHKVTAFNDSRLAMQAFSDNPMAFDLIITDQTMPHLSGLELARRSVGLRSDLPVILCTGHSDQVTPQSLAACGVRRLLYKPVDRRELSEAIAQALGWSAGQA